MGDYCEKESFHNYLQEIYKKNFNGGLINPLLRKNYDISLKNKFFQELLDTKKNPPKIPKIEEEQKMPAKGKGDEPQFFMNSLYLYTIKKDWTPEKMTLKINKNPFYYNETTRIYYHSASKKVFFFNVWDLSSNQFKNYFCDSEGSEVEMVSEYEVKPMSHYSDNNTYFLVDFSICSSKTTIYLIWGLEANLMGEINKNIYAYSISKDRWTQIKIKKEEVEPMIPRIKAASIVVENPKTNTDIIYVFGGTGFDKKHDTYNIVDHFIVNLKTFETNYYKISKDVYENNSTYKPLNNSMVFAVKGETNKFIMIGGTMSEFSVNSRNNILSAVLITITEFAEDEKKKIKQENAKKLLNEQTNIDGGIKNVKFTHLVFEKYGKKSPIDSSKYRELNLILSQVQSFSQTDNILNAVISSIVTDSRGTFCSEEITQITKSFFLKKNVDKTEDNKEPELISKLRYHTESDMNGQKSCFFKISCTPGENQPLYEEQKRMQSEVLTRQYEIKPYEVFLKKETSDFLLFSEDKPQLLMLSLADNKGKKKEQKYTPSDFQIHYLELTFPDLIKNKKNYLYSDYQLSRSKVTNYFKFDDKIYILVNNPNDNNNKRQIYALSLANINLKSTSRQDPSKIYSDDLKVSGTSLLIDPYGEIYLIGGKILQKQKTESFISQKPPNYNRCIKENQQKGFEIANNVECFVSPYVFWQNGCVICIERHEQHSIYGVYGEILSLKNQENSEWKPFIIYLEEMIISWEIDIQREEEQVIVKSLVFVGKNQNEDHFFLVEYENLKAGQLFKKVIVLNFKNFLTNSNSSSILEKKQLQNINNWRMDTEECYFRVQEGGKEYNDTELLFFNSDLLVGKLI